MHNCLSLSGVIFFVPFHGSVEGCICLALGSSRCDVNVSFRQRLLLPLRSFNVPPTVCIVGFVTVRGVIGGIEWSSCPRQQCRYWLSSSSRGGSRHYSLHRPWPNSSIPSILILQCKIHNIQDCNLGGSRLIEPNYIEFVLALAASKQD